MIETLWVIILSFSLFAIGILGLISRRNLLFILLSIEIMLNGIILLFVAASNLHGNNDGQIMYLLVLTLAASEVAVALALVMQIYRQQQNLDVDTLTKLRG